MPTYATFSLVDSIIYTNMLNIVTTNKMYNLSKVQLMVIDMRCGEHVHTSFHETKKPIAVQRTSSQRNHIHEYIITHLSYSAWAKVDLAP
mmetsp:Transcript_2917/g.3421  ORF Transcript_2917/g.3421 Transcript_2917/m.3421 type:complete len:90 (+) Transcript_2917:31-300(+)